MLKGFSTRMLLLGALGFPLVALLIVGTLLLSSSPRPVVVEANIWPQSVDLAESLHLEAILVAQVEAAEGNASQADLDDQRRRTDGFLERWALGGTDAGQFMVQLAAARLPEEGRTISEAQELLALAETVRAEANRVSPSVIGVSDLLVAARSDALVAVSGADVATLTTAAKAQRTRIAGMVDATAVSIDSAVPADAQSLDAVLAESSLVQRSLIDAEPVTIREWIDAHVERQRAIGELARAGAVRGAPLIDEEVELPVVPLSVVTFLGLAGLIGFGFAVGSRLATRSDDLVQGMKIFAKRTVPSALLESGGLADDSVGEIKTLSEQIEPISIRGDLQVVGDAFNEVQESTAYVIDTKAAGHRFITERIFSSMADRNRTVVEKQLESIEELAMTETDLGRLDRFALLDSQMRRMQRDVVSLGALAGEEHPIIHEDRSLGELIEAAVDETRGAQRMRVLQVDDVLIDGSGSADVSHVVTELLENALHSSPPESIVELLCSRTDRSSLLVSIADEGFGMDPDEMEGLNQVLATASPLRAETAGTLGIVALSVIAARSNVGIRFTPSPQSGVTALVTVPAELVSELPKDWTPSPRLAPQARVHERLATESATAADTALELGSNASDDDSTNDGESDHSVRERGLLEGGVLEGGVLKDGVLEEREQPGKVDGVDADIEHVDDRSDVGSFDRELPIAEFEYDLDDSAPAPMPRTDNDALTSDDLPLSMVDLDESPFAADFDDDLDGRGAGLVPGLRKRNGKSPSEPAITDTSGPTRRLYHQPEEPKAQDESDDSEETGHDPAESPRDDEIEPGDSASDPETQDEKSDLAVPKPVADSADIDSDSSFGADEDNKPATYAALESLLADLPESTDGAEPPQRRVPKAFVARRVSTATPTVLPSELGDAAVKRSRPKPKSPEEVRDMLTRYRPGGGEGSD